MTVTVVSMPIRVGALDYPVSTRRRPRAVHLAVPASKALCLADAAERNPSAVADAVYVSGPTSITSLVETHPATTSALANITSRLARPVVEGGETVGGAALTGLPRPSSCQWPWV